MPGSTPNLSLPYPLAAEPFAIGNENIQALAEDLDDKLTQYARARRFANQTIATATTTNVQWTAADSDLSADFDLTTDTVADDELTYNGPDRFILFNVVVQFQLAVTTNTGVVQLQRTTPATDGQFVMTDRRDFSELNSASPLAVCGMVWVQTGDTFRVQVTQTTGSDKTIKAYLNAKVVL